MSNLTHSPLRSLAVMAKRNFIAHLIGAALGFAALDANAGLVFNEILFDPAADTAGDANGDGSRSASDDEFLEIVNDDAVASVDISGYTISDSDEMRHAFPAGTIVPPGGAIVVFGGGDLTGSFFGGAIVQPASTGGLSLNNGGDTLTLNNDGGLLMAEFTYPDTGFTGSDQSATRAPDITGSFVDHSTTTAGLLFSPGLTVDGNPFVVPEPTTGLLLLLGSLSLGLNRRRLVAPRLE